MSKQKEVEEFVDYLIEDLDKKQLAVLYYQVCHNMANIASDELDEDVNYEEIHNGNLAILTDIIVDNHTQETRQ